MRSFIHPASIPVLVTNTVTGDQKQYPSVNKAAQALKTDQPTVSRALKHGYRVYKHTIIRA